MVQYDPRLSVIPHPPPICPKCGSHRTQVVGISGDGLTIVVRCNACGERSEVKMMPAEQPAAVARVSARPFLSR